MITIFENGTWEEPSAPRTWKDQWEKHVWYSKKKDQLILSDRLRRTRTCNQAGGIIIPDYIPHSFEYVGEL